MYAIRSYYGSVRRLRRRAIPAALPDELMLRPVRPADSFKNRAIGALVAVAGVHEMRERVAHRSEVRDLFLDSYNFV